MTLSAARLTTPIKDALVDDAGAFDGAATLALATAIATELVTEIKKGKVLPGTFAAPPGAPTTPGGAITGASVVTDLDPTRPKAALKNALIAAGAADIAATGALAEALATGVCDALEGAVIAAGTLSCPPGGGAITGSAIVVDMTVEDLRDDTKGALIDAGAADNAATHAFAESFAQAIVDELEGHLAVSGFSAPAAGGPLTGTGALS